MIDPQRVRSKGSRVSRLLIFVRRLKKNLSRALGRTPEPLFARVLGLTIGAGIGKVIAVLMLGRG